MRSVPNLQTDLPETHISSIVVLCRPENFSEAQTRINEFGFADVHATDDNGKLVVVLESESQRGLLDHIEQIESINGVISATLVYHQVD